MSTKRALHVRNKSICTYLQMNPSNIVAMSHAKETFNIAPFEQTGKESRTGKVEGVLQVATKFLRFRFGKLGFSV